MAKKSRKAKLPIVYLIGMLAVIVGFICPMFEDKLLGIIPSSNGFDFINFKNSSFVSIGAILIIAGAIAGAIAAFLPKMKMLKVIGLVVTIMGGIILVIGFTTNGGVYKVIGKGLFKSATYGFYTILVGWVIALVGFVTNK